MSLCFELSFQLDLPYTVLHFAVCSMTNMLFLTFPFVMPIINSLDINLIWWGVVYVMAGGQASMTPPFGLSLAVLHGVVPWHPMETIARGALPFLIPIYMNILLLMFFPQLALWLPGLLGGVQ